MTNAAYSALIHTAAISIDVALTDSAMSFLVDESDRFIKDFLNQALVVALTSRPTALSKQHFDKVLKSRGQLPLLGYEPNLEQKELISNGEYAEQEYNTVPITKYLKKPRNFSTRKIPYSLHYILVDGVKNPSNGLGSKQRGDRNRTEAPECVSSVLSKKQIDFIVETLSYMRIDSNNSFDVGLKEVLEKEERIDVFAPYFLHIITARMTMCLHNIESMSNLLHITIALASNPHLDLLTYFHPFLRVCMSALISSDVGSNESDDDSPVRRLSSELFHILHVKCRKAFPLMTDAIYNYLIGVLFDPSTSIAAHTGCIFGFIALGTPVCEKTLPHLPGYLSVLKAISQRCTFEKCYQGRVMIDAVRELCEKVQIETETAEFRYRAEEILDSISLIVFN